MITLSRYAHTPVDHWMDMPILDMFDWIEICVELAEEQDKKDDEAWQKYQESTNKP